MGLVAQESPRITRIPPGITEIRWSCPGAGLPQLTAGWWFPLRAPSAQLTLAVLIVLVDGVEAMSIAKSLAAANGYELDATQDLRGGGGGSMGQCVPCVLVSC